MTGIRLLSLKDRRAPWRSDISEGKPSRRSRQAVVRRLKGSDPNVRRSAAWVLGQICAEPALAVPVLVETHEDPEDFVCEQAIHSIGEFGPDAYQAQPRLRNLLHDRTPQIGMQPFPPSGRSPHNGVVPRM